MDTGPKKKVQISTFIIAIYIFLAPLDMILNFSGDGTILRYIGLMIIFCILTELFIYKNNLIIQKQMSFLMLFLLYSLLSYFWSVSPSDSSWSIISLGNLILLVFFMLSREYSLREIKLIKLFSVAGILTLCFIMVATSSDVYFGRGSVGIGGVYVDPNDLSAAFILPILFCLEAMRRIKNKGIYFVLIVVSVFMVYGLLITGSRGGLLAVVISSIFYLYKVNSKGILTKILISTFVFLVILGFYNLTFDYLSYDVQNRLSFNALMESGGSGRLFIWYEAINIFNNSGLYRLLAGHGFGTFYFIHEVGSHNLFLQLLLDVGIIGFLIFISIIFILALKCIKQKDWLSLSILIGTLIMSLTIETWNKKFFWNAIFFVLLTNNAFSNVAVLKSFTRKDLVK